MKHSLQRHLSLMLGSAVVLSGLVAGLASFILAYGEAKEFQDDMLRQIAVLDGKGSMGHGLPTAEGTADDQESRIVILRLPVDPRPAWLPATLGAGFHTLDSPLGRLRVYVRETAGGRQTVVAQPTDVPDEIAMDSALRTLIPLLLLLPVLAWLIVRILRREFAPVSQLARDLDSQAPDRPGPVPDAGLPEEITPFVHAINRLLDRVNQLMSRQRRFIADAAHELRSPLTALSVQAENLRQAESLEAMKERTAPLQAGIERARQLTEQLLNLARVQGGTAEEAVTDIPSLARELIAEFLPRAEQRNIDLGLDERARFALRASPQSLRLILGNALDNALKYTHSGGEVTLRLLTEGDTAVIEVVDNGPGIPPEERERVFDAFHRLPGSAATGSGLGLAIAREAALRLGGEVALREPEHGSGLVFSYRQKPEP